MRDADNTAGRRTKRTGSQWMPRKDSNRNWISVHHLRQLQCRSADQEDGDGIANPEFRETRFLDSFGAAHDPEVGAALRLLEFARMLFR
jgi:hypothetical protein